MPSSHSSWRAASLLIVCSIVVVAPLQAQEDDEADHDALRAIGVVATEAINTNQLELFRPYMADEFSIVTYTDREFSDYDAFKTRWQQTRGEVLDGGTYSTTLNPDRSRIIGDVAIAQGNAANVLTTGAGDRYEFPSHWTAVLQKVDGQWKVVRSHSSLSPFDNPMLKAGVEGALWKTSGAGLAAGLVLGCVGTWLVGRRGRTSAGT